MFDPTKEVPSLELCEKLKEAGFPQDGTGWYWIKKPIGHEHEWKLILIEDIHRTIDNYKVKAPIRNVNILDNNVNYIKIIKGDEYGK